MVEKAQPHVMDENPDPPAPGVGDEVFEAALVEYHALAATVDGESCIYITAAPGDPANPRNWPNWKRCKFFPFIFAFVRRRKKGRRGRS